MVLKDLSEAIGVSGDEWAVRKIIREAIQDHVTDIRVDSLGNLTAMKKGTGETNLQVLIAAHMDEVGFMVTGIDSNGLIQFKNIGGMDDRILPSLRVKIGNKHIPGVIIWTPIHLNNSQNVVPIKNLRIDIGASSKEGANGKVKPGDHIAFDSEYRELSETMVRGKAFDDRAGCAMLVELLQGEPYAVDVVGAFTVQEEVGLRGAKVVARHYQPDLALILEGTTAHDVPNPLADIDDDLVPNPGCRLGYGPALTVMDKSMIVNPRILNFIRETATANDIPYQLKTALGVAQMAVRFISPMRESPQQSSQHPVAISIARAPS